MTSKEREEAITTIKRLDHDFGDYEPNHKVFENILSALKGEWIPVSRKLPDEEHEVYCQLSDGSNAVLYVQDNWGQMEWVDGMMGTGTYDVVAWREKPEPYQKGGE